MEGESTPIPMVQTLLKGERLMPWLKLTEFTLSPQTLIRRASSVGTTGHQGSSQWLHFMVVRLMVE